MRMVDGKALSAPLPNWNAAITRILRSSWSSGLTGCKGLQPTLFFQLDMFESVLGLEKMVLDQLSSVFVAGSWVLIVEPRGCFFG